MKTILLAAAAAASLATAASAAPLNAGGLASAETAKTSNRFAWSATNMAVASVREARATSSVTMTTTPT
ncbi:hypothetical protein ACVWWG_004583 [Bradyrhizobium sp. LB7.2]